MVEIVILPRWQDQGEKNSQSLKNPDNFISGFIGRPGSDQTTKKEGAGLGIGHQGLNAGGQEGLQ